MSSFDTFLPSYLCVSGSCVFQLLHRQLMRLPEEQQLLVQEAHLLLGALAAAQLKDERDKRRRRRTKKQLGYK